MTDSTMVSTAPASPARSARLLEFDLLRVLCCLGVLGIHISGFYWAQKGIDPSFKHLVSFAVLNEAVRYALFGFMFLSGVMLTVRQANFQVGHFLSKRVFTILVPYLAWNLLYFPVKMAVPLLRGDWATIALAVQNNWLDWLLFGTWDHLYYINMLFQMLLLYALLHRPIAWLLANQQRAIGLLIALVLLYPLWKYFRFVPYRHPEVNLPDVFLWMAKNPNRTAFEWLVPFGFGLVGGAYYPQTLAWIRRFWPFILLVTLAALAGQATVSGTPWLTAKRVEDLQNYGWPSSYILPLLRMIYAFGFTSLTLVGAKALLARVGDARPAWLRVGLAFSAASFGIYLVHPALLWLLREVNAPGSTRGISFALYSHSPYLYLAGIGLCVTGLSFAAVWILQTLGARWRWLSWLPKGLFGG